MVLARIDGPDAIFRRQSAIVFCSGRSEGRPVTRKGCAGRGRGDRAAGGR